VRRDDPNGFGPTLASLRRGWAHLDDESVEFAIEVVARCRIVDQLAEWNRQERDRLERHAGGAPLRFPPHALLVAMVLAAVHGFPLLATEFVNMLFRRISPAMRTRLGVEEPPDEDDDLRWKALYRCVRYRFHSIFEPIDPSPLPKNRCVDPDTFDRMVDQRMATKQLNAGVLAERADRLAWVQNAFLETAWSMLPRTIRRHWKGNVAVDATPVPAFAQPDRRARGKGPRAKRKLLRHSADPDAAPYVRTGPPSDLGTSLKGNKRLAQFVWAYEATLVVAAWGEPTEEQPFPSLVVAMANLHNPGHAISHHAITALGSAAERGHPIALLAGDRAYSNANPDDFQLPARALGYDLVLDYRDDQLGIQGSYEGFLFIEGAFYCPAMPQQLIQATIDYRNKRTDHATWQARLEARRAHQARPKGNPDAEGSQRVLCPASDGAYTGRCELKPRSIKNTDTKLTRIPVTDELRLAPPKVCRQQSITVPPDAAAKLRHNLDYGLPEWSTTYHGLRNSVEGMNGVAKNGAYAALADPTRRRIRGVMAQSIFTALLIMATSINQIDSFLKNARPDSEGTLRRPRKRRRASRPLSDWSPSVTQRSGAPPG
jgi:hypothetical protein